MHVLMRWKPLPRQLRWLLGGAVVVATALAVAWALFVPAADWLAHHDVGLVTGSLREKALDDARGRVLTLGAGLFAAGALWFTARNFKLSRQQLQQSGRQFVAQLEQSRRQFTEQTEESRRQFTEQLQQSRQQFTEQLELSRKAAQESAEAERRTLELTEQGQVTDRYTKAIEQLGSDKLDVRIGGIYALQRIANDSAQDHPTVMEVLAAFVRDHSRKQPSSDDAHSNDEEASFREFPADLQAALEVIGRRDASRDTRQIRLWGVRCAGAYLRDLNFSAASFFEADLTRATLVQGRLERVVFSSANLSGARLIHADLSRVVAVC